MRPTYALLFRPSGFLLVAHILANMTFKQDVGRHIIWFLVATIVIVTAGILIFVSCAYKHKWRQRHQPPVLEVLSLDLLKSYAAVKFVLIVQGIQVAKSPGPPLEQGYCVRHPDGCSIFSFSSSLSVQA